MNRKCIYLVEGECEEKLIKRFRKSAAKQGSADDLQYTYAQAGRGCRGAYSRKHRSWCCLADYADRGWQPLLQGGAGETGGVILCPRYC